MLRQIEYDCGCSLKEEGLKLCDLHFAICNLDVSELKTGLSQERYNQLVHFLNQEQEERANFH